jgi:4-amino-4-deoxy-L-arabinose transferase-like glycosyltransferase
VEALALGLPLALLAALSLYQLGALSLWRDEVASVVFARGSLADLVTIVGRDRDAVGLANMATYYLVLHFWLALGDSEAWLRLPSVAFGVATVIPVYLVGRRLGGWLVAGLAAAIFALIPFVIHYNQEVRGYSLSMLVAAGLTWLLLVGVERRERTWPWLAYGIVAALGIYVHFFVALVVAAHGIWVLGTRQLPRLPAVLAALVPISLAAAPIPFIVLEFGGEQEWVPPLSGPVAARALVGLAGSAPLLLATSVLLGYGIVRLSADRRAWLLAGSVLLPIVGAVAISVVKPMFVGRYLIMVLPMLAVLVAWTLASVRPPALAIAAALTLGALLLVAVPSAYRDAHEQDWRAAGRWLATEVEPGDALIAQNGRRPLEYYIDAAGGVVPRSTRVALALDDATAQRVWVAVLGDQDPGYVADVPDRLSAAFATTQRRQFGDRLAILLMTKRPAS